MKQREKLYLKYLKMAAEAGVIEAQHNLGCEYLDGKRMPKDEVKALAWFLHASANGFIESKVNRQKISIMSYTCSLMARNAAESRSTKKLPY